MKEPSGEVGARCSGVVAAEPWASRCRTRRGFLAESAVASFGLVAGVGSGCQTRETRGGRSGIIDSHTHFYDPTRPQGVPWPPREDALLYRPVYPDEFERLAGPLGVTATVVVEASAWEDDNAWVLALAERHPSLVGMVGRLRPGTPAFEAGLARFRPNPRFRGIRIGAEVVSRVGMDAALRGDLARIGEAGLAVDVLVGPDGLSAVAAMASALPGLTLVVDHCANVRVDGGTPPKEWAAGVRQCARHENVYLKVSGLVEGTGRARGDAPGDTEFYRPVLGVIREAFGPERLIFGSNWPVSARFASYGTVLRVVQEYFEDQGSAAAGLYFAGNAIRAYRLMVRGFR